ncbi:MAG: AAA family ATPase [Bergeyella sp.]
MSNHIQNIEISNFKSVKDLKIKGCKKINIFAGKPNAGKSNILEGLGLLGIFDYHKNQRLNFHNFLRFEYFNELFFEENQNEPIFLKTQNLILKVEIDERESILKFLYNDSKLKNEKKIDFQYSPDYHFILKEMNSKIEFNKIRKYNFNSDAHTFIKEDSFIFPNGDNLAHVITLNENLRNELRRIFKNSNLNILIDKGLNALKIYKEFEDGTIFTLPYKLVADTLQRLIFYKAAIMSNDNSVLLFEEPEAHCFEPYILEFTNEVKFNENNNQFFMVTHSDFIIQEFLRDEESRKDTQIYLVNNVNGKTEVKALEAKKNEDVYEYGMNVFFNFDSLWENN